MRKKNAQILSLSQQHQPRALSADATKDFHEQSASPMRGQAMQQKN